MRKPRGAEATADSAMSGRQVRIWDALRGRSTKSTAARSMAAWIAMVFAMVEIVLPSAHTAGP